MIRAISLLGSTGSIGRQTLEVCEETGVKVEALTARSNVDLLEEQVRRFHPRLAVLGELDAARALKSRLADVDVEVAYGLDGLLRAAALPESDAVVTAVVGIAGLRPTLAAIEKGKRIALANKETLVTAGHMIIPLAEEKGARMLPVDSEHSAIFQCLNGEQRNKIERILLTASGGPFRGRTREELKHVRLEDALKHPNWSMGRKITVDSSTMVNKGLEVMEARWLFDVSFDEIQVVIQPKSIIHSMVQFQDGAVMAQLGTPDMKLPIQYALYYPERRNLGGERLDFWSLKEIIFEKPDPDTFRGLSLAYEAGRAGGSTPCVFNAANERAVAKFLAQEIPYLEITDIIESAMGHHIRIEEPSLEEILSAEAETYEFIESRWRRD